MRKLDSTQVASFDTDYVEGERWDTVKSLVDRDFPDGSFSFLDVGGGNGVFADRLLEAYPRARGTVVDNSEVLLARNQTSDRKTLMLESVQNLSRITEKFDLVFVHWLLHHLIGDSYGQTRGYQLSTLRSLLNFLTDRGRVSLYENCCNGWLVDSLPGRVIYQVTSARAIGGIIRRMGANTGGVGLCYLSKQQWLSSVRAAGFEVDSYAEPDTWVWPVRPEWRVFLHVGSIRVGHFWLRGDSGSARHGGA